MNDRIKELVEKLNRLAEGAGNANEKNNAKKKLDELCKKYEISQNDLNEEKTYYRIFKYNNNDDKMIVLQVISKVLNKLLSDIDFYNVKKKNKLTPKTFGIYVTELQYMEILYLSNFYSELWKQERKFFLHVYINKHDLFPACQVGIDPKRNIEEELKVRSALRAMQDKTPLKAIEHKSV